MIIKAINLEKSFRVGNVDNLVINNINLEIDEGEFIAIMGPSGSGKTTLMYLLSGLEKKTGGELYLFDKEISLYKDKELSNLRKNKLSFIFQFYNLIPNLTVYENIKLASSISKTKADIDYYIDYVGLTKYKNYYPDMISGGMCQRVAIARALVNDAPIIFADEPVGALDSKMGNEILELLEKINKEKNKTIIMVTHLESNSQFATRVINILDGKILSDIKK